MNSTSNNTSKICCHSLSCVIYKARLGANKFGRPYGGLIVGRIRASNPPSTEHTKLTFARNFPIEFFILWICLFGYGHMLSMAVC
jgi:hypothetical protein